MIVKNKGKLKIEIRLKSEGISIIIPEENIMMQGFNITSSINNDDSLELGALSGQSLSFKIIDKDNSIKKYSLRGGEIDVMYEYQIGDAPDILGTFIIEEAKRNIDTISIEAYDITRGLGKTYANNTLEYPTSLRNVVENIGKEFNFNIENKFLNDGLIVDLDDEEKNKYTYRDILSFAIAISGGFGFFTKEVGDKRQLLKIRTYSGRYNNPIEVKDNIKSISIDESYKISGVVYYLDVDNILLVGDKSNPIIVKNNPFIDSLNDPEDFIDYLGDIYVGLKYNPINIDLYYTKNIRVGYVIEGDDFKSFITSISGSPGGALNLNTSGSSNFDFDILESEQIKNKKLKNRKKLMLKNIVV